MSHDDTNSAGSTVTTIRAYCPASFWTVEGAAKLRRRFESWGVPSLRNWRFITLTIDRELYPDPEKAYELGKQYVADFRAAFKKAYPHENQFTKFELHDVDENGDQYPHWHLLVDFKRKVDFALVMGMWRMGRLQVQRVETDVFSYLFKYVTKTVDDLPEWLLKRSVVRAWSASRGFFLHRARAEKAASSDLDACEPEDGSDYGRGDRLDDFRTVAPGVLARDVPVERQSSPTLGARLKRWARSVTVTQERSDGKVMHSVRICAVDSWSQFLGKVASEKLAHFMRSSALTISEKEVTCLNLQKLPQGLLLYT